MNSIFFSIFFGSAIAGSSNFCTIEEYASALSTPAPCESRKIDRSFFSRSLLPLDKDSFEIMNFSTAVVTSNLRRSKSFRSLPEKYQKKIISDGLLLVTRVSPDLTDSLGLDTYEIEFEINNGEWAVLRISAKRKTFYWYRMVY